MTLAINNSRELSEAARKKFGWIPNTLTRMRILAAFLVLGLFVWARIASFFPETIVTIEHMALIALIVGAVGAATDFLDGWSARRLGCEENEFGKKFDPRADKIFSVTIALATPLELGAGMYLIPYFLLLAPIAFWGKMTDNFRNMGLISGANYAAKIKTAVLMVGQTIFLTAAVFEDVWIREQLIAIGLASFAVAAIGAKIAINDYRAQISADWEET